MSDAILVKLSISKWGASKTDKEVTNEVNALKGADSRAGKYVKNLIDPKALKGINAVLSEIRVMHYSLTRPWDDTSRRLLPATLKNEYDSKLNGLKFKFERELGDFIEIYPSLIKEAEISLGSMFDASQYPTQDNINYYFSVGCNFEPVPSGAALPMTIEDREALARTIEKQTRLQMKSSADALFHQTVKKLRDSKDRITSYQLKLGRGERTALHTTLLTDLQELAQLLPILNIENDPFLDGIAKRIDHELSGVEMEDLREDANLRINLADNLDKLANEMEQQ